MGVVVPIQIAGYQASPWMQWAAVGLLIFVLVVRELAVSLGPRYRGLVRGVTVLVVPLLFAYVVVIASIIANFISKPYAP